MNDLNIATIYTFFIKTTINIDKETKKCIGNKPISCKPMSYYTNMAIDYCCLKSVSGATIIVVVTNT
jgi:hypothetical protein